MSKAKLKAARDLINELNYDAARAILRTIPDDPIAQEWLAKLDRIAPEAPPAAPAPPAEAGRTARAEESIRRLPDDPALQPRTETPHPTYPRQPDIPAARPRPRPQKPDAPALQRARWRLRWLRLWQVLWGALALVALGWILYGIYGTLAGDNPLANQVQQAIGGVIDSVTGTVGTQVEIAPSVTDSAREAGATVSTGVSIIAFICSGLPFLLVFLALYRRASAAFRDERQHKEVLETMQHHAGR